MQDKKQELNVHDFIIEKFNAQISHGSNKSIKDTEKANLLFAIVLDFIKAKKWEYFPDGNKVCEINLLQQSCSSPLQANCFDLSETFVELCKSIGINDVDTYVYLHQPIQLGKKIPGSNDLYACFDKTQKHIDNQGIFDKHCVAMIGGRFYDLVFSCSYDSVNDPFEKDAFFDLVALMETKNEKTIISKLKDISKSDLEKTFEGKTLLFRAANLGLYEVVSYLLDKGADANIRSKDEFSQVPLDLISNTKSPLFNLLYKHTQKPSANDILFQGVLMGSLEEIKDALAKGLPVDYQDSSGWTLLHWAASNNREDIVKYLLELGADANKKTFEEISQVPLAFVQNNNSNLFKLLYEHTNKSLANLYKNTNVGNISNASSKCSFSDMESYISQGNEAEAIRKLKYLDKSCFSKTSQGQTLLYQALAAGFCDLATLLMRQSKTINLNYKGPSGWTLLHWAAHYNFKDISATLLKMGADPTLKTKDDYQQLPLDFVQDTKSDLFNLLYESTRSADQLLAETTLFAKISSSLSDCSLDLVKDALKKGLSVNYKDSAGWTLLHWAALNKREDIVSYLLEIGASSNTQSIEEIPHIPLDFVEDTNSKLFELLYRHTDKSQVNINIQNKLLESAMVMVQQGDLEALSNNFEKLDLNMQDNRGWTLLHQAVICKKESIVVWLKKNEADATIKNNNGKTASELLVASPSKESVSSTFSSRFFVSNQENKNEQGDSPTYKRTI